MFSCLFAIIKFFIPISWKCEKSEFIVNWKYTLSVFIFDLYTYDTKMYQKNSWKCEFLIKVTTVALYALFHYDSFCPLFNGRSFCYNEERIEFPFHSDLSQEEVLHRVNDFPWIQKGHTYLISPAILDFFFFAYFFADGLCGKIAPLKMSLITFLEVKCSAALMGLLVFKSGHDFWNMPAWKLEHY